MIIPCEIAVKTALPSVRAMIANDLIERHRLNQTETANLLELSQSAVSLYQQKLRGNLINLENDAEVKSLITLHVDSLISSKLSLVERLSSFCEICKLIRAKGYLCSIHKSSDPTADKDCNFCKTHSCWK